MFLLNISEKPASPRNLTATDVTPGKISLTWDAPEDGATVQQYIVVMRESQKKKFKKVGRVDGNRLGFDVVASLEGGHEYVLRVYAENEAGISDVAAELGSPVTVPKGGLKENGTPEMEELPSEVTKEETEKVQATEKVQETALVEEINEKAKEEVPEKQEQEEELEKVDDKITVPSAPRNVGIAKVTGDSIKVIWEAPETDGGTPLKGYVLAVRDAAKKKFKDVGKVNAKTLTFKVKKLKEGHEYFVKVYAESEAGVSEVAGELAMAVKVGLPQAQVSIHCWNYLLVVLRLFSAFQ